MGCCVTGPSIHPGIGDGPYLVSSREVYLDVASPIGKGQAKDPIRAGSTWGPVTSPGQRRQLGM